MHADARGADVNGAVYMASAVRRGMEGTLQGRGLCRGEHSAACQCQGPAGCAACNQSEGVSGKAQ